jgi:protein SCO1/2
MDGWRESRCVSALGMQSLLRIIVSGFIVAGVIVATALAGPVRPAQAAKLQVTIGGPFTLVAPDGTTVTERSYRGKWLLVYFGYTSCPNSCPTALLEIADALQRLGSEAAGLQPLFITVDPLRDTRSVLGEYAGSFDPRIVGLSGEPEQIAAVAKEYGVYYVRHDTGSDNYVMDHSTYIYLMDFDGRFVRAFDADTSGAHIAETVRALMVKIKPGGEHGDRS